MLKTYTLAILVLWIIIGASCSRIKPEEPVAVPFEDTIATELSYLSAPIVISVEDLEDKVNGAVKDVVVNDNSFTNNGGDNAKLRVTRLGNISITLSGNEMYYSLPLNVHFEGRITKTAVGITVKKEQAVDFAMRVSFRSVLNFGSDWKIDSKTDLQSMTWISRPTLRVGPVKIQLATLVEKKLREKTPVIEAQIDYLLHEKLKIRQQALKIWQDLQKPILINKRHTKVWLKANPVDFMASRINGNNRYLIVNARMSAYTQTLIGESPAFLINDKLPPLKIVGDLDNTCDLNVLSNIEYADLNDLLAEKLEGKQFDIKGHKLKIADMSVYGSGKEIIVRADVKGDVKGSIFFRGVPAYDSARQTISIQKFDFDVRTEEVLVSAADWLLHDTFKDKVQEVLHLPLADHVGKIPELIQRGIEKNKIGKKISLAVSGLDLHPKRIVVRPEGIHLLINVRANIVLSLDQL